VRRAPSTITALTITIGALVLVPACGSDRVGDSDDGAQTTAGSSGQPTTVAPEGSAAPTTTPAPTGPTTTAPAPTGPTTTTPLGTSPSTVVPVLPTTEGSAATTISTDFPPPSGSYEAQAIADLAGRLGAQPGAITTVSVEAVTWPDSSLGCPQPGMSYLQVMTDGARIVVEVDGRQYVYHAGGSRQPFLCEKPQPPGG
jgi:hypothetical protein